jgi:hypothetical protein
MFACMLCTDYEWNRALSARVSSCLTKMESQHLIQNTKWHRIYLYNIVTVDLKSPTSCIWFITLTHPFIRFYSVHKKEKSCFLWKRCRCKRGEGLDWRTWDGVEDVLRLVWCLWRQLVDRFMKSRLIYWVSQKRSCGHVARLHGALPSKKGLPCRIEGNRNNKKFPWEVTSRVGQRIQFCRTINKNHCDSVLCLLSNIPSIKSSTWLLWHLNNSMQQISIWEADSRVPNQEITRLLRDLECSVTCSRKPIIKPHP